MNYDNINIETFIIFGVQSQNIDLLHNIQYYIFTIINNIYLLIIYIYYIIDKLLKHISVIPKK